MHNKRSTCSLVDKNKTGVFWKDISWAIDLYEGVNQDFVHNDALTTCKFTTLLGQDPMKCKHWETVVAAECPGETTIKNKTKQNKGILNLSTHKEKLLGGWSRWKTCVRLGRCRLSDASLEATIATLLPPYA